MGFVLVVIFSLLTSCSGSKGQGIQVNRNEDLIQQTGDLLTSIDEMFASGYNNPALAVNCWYVGFSACSNNKKSKDFAGCKTRLSGTIEGLVDLTFNPGTNCALNNINNQVTRDSNYTIRARNGVTYSISGSQTLTRTSGSSFDFAISNIRRQVQVGGVTQLDFSTYTDSSPIQIQGTGSRDDRQITSGQALVNINSPDSMQCNMNFQNISWSLGCSCPTSGTVGVTCPDGSNQVVTFSNLCGTVTVYESSKTSEIDLDRCY